MKVNITLRKLGKVNGKALPDLYAVNVWSWVFGAEQWVCAGHYKTLRKAENRRNRILAGDSRGLLAKPVE